MSRRSRAREVALQLLFQQDQNKVAVRRPAVERFAADRLGEPELAAFCLDLADGVNKHRAELDALISATAENWKLHRMMPVDRNVLRIGAFELLHSPDQSPVAVVLNEAIELARRFGTADSPAFVNGILDKISKGRKAEGGRGTEEPTADTSEPPPSA